MAVTRSTQGWPPESTIGAGDADEADASGLSNTPGERWYSCDRCGFLFPTSQLIIEVETGLRVCTTGPHDHDKPSPDDIRAKSMSRLFLPEEVTE